MNLFNHPSSTAAKPSRSTPAAVLFTAFVAAGLATNAHAVDGTWTKTASGGLWSDTANWSGATLADGSGFTANFSTLNISVDNTVLMDTSRTLTNLTFADATNPTHGWTLSNNGNAANILTLAGTTPTITVGAQGTRTATISAVIAGTSGLTVAGTGRLGLSGANTYSGGTTVGSTSTLVIGVGSTNTGSTINSGATGVGDVTFANGASLSTTSSIGSSSWLMPTLTLQGTLNLVGTHRQALSFNTLELTSGTKTLNVNGKGMVVTGGSTISSENTGNSQWEMASTNAFTNTVKNGTLALETTAFTGSTYGLMRINNAMTFSNADLQIGSNVILLAGAGSGALGTSAATSPNVTLNGNGILSLVAANTKIVSLKSLAGTGSVFGSMVAANANNVTLALNGTGGATTFAGTIGNGAGTGALALSKTGASTQILTGTNTYTGLTAISAGTLQLGAGGTTGSLASTGSIVNNANLTINRSNAVVQGVDFSSAAITGTGSFTQAGTGTTTLTAANTYGGLTTISGGTLQLGAGGATGSLSATGSIVNNGNLTINRSNSVTQGTDFSSAAITGTGSFTQSGIGGTTTLTAANTFSGLVTVNFGSTLATNGTGTFGSGDITIATGGTLQLGNANSIANSANVKIDVGSSLLLFFTGTETVNSLSSVSGGFIAAGTYDATQLQAFFGDSVFAFSGTLNVLSGSASAVPEPSTYAALAGLGVLGFAAYRRRKAS